MLRRFQSLFVAVTSPEQEKQQLLALLQRAAAYAHNNIEESAALPGSDVCSIPFTNMAITNMRGDIHASAKAIFPGQMEDAKCLESAPGYSNPLLLEVKKRHILATKKGNCGEFVELAIIFLLEHKDRLANVTLSVESILTSGGANHLSLKVDKLLANGQTVSLLFDPTLEEVCDMAEKKGNVFRLGSAYHDRSNVYIPLDESKGHSKQTIVVYDPASIAYPLSADECADVDEVVPMPGPTLQKGLK